MNIRKRFFRRNTVTSLCVAIVATTLMTGCITDPKTGQSMLDPKAGGAIGALLGGFAGGFAGNAIYGKKEKGAAIGAAIGAAVGGTAGYFITDYLNEQERQEYLANLNQQMRATPINADGSNSWTNANRTKNVDTYFSQQVTLKQVLAEPNNKLPLNQQRIASLPSTSTCRIASSKFQNNGQQASIVGAYCRDANGDYVKVNGTDA